MNEYIDIKCRDGYVLKGIFYPSLGAPKKAEPILISPATGIVQQFYKSFALWLSEQGYDVLTFDFRGIGASLNGPLKNSKASIQDWGLLDLPAVIETLLKKTGAAQVNIIGHSAGGQLLGLVDNYQQVKQVIAVAGSSGHVKGLKGRTKILAPVMFNLLFPLSSLFKGYGATKMIGMGENLPKGVARQWAEFCSRPGYVKNAIGKTVKVDFHQKIHCPITAIAATDDEIATEKNVDDLLSLYPNAQTKKIILQPKHYGHRNIGHMLMFKPSHQNLWVLIEQQLLA